MDTTVAYLLGAACVLVIIECAVFWHHLSHLRTLADERPADPVRWPRVSVIIAARDEADSAGAAMAARLADDYPDLELIFVDDRSTDGTADVVRLAAAGDPRLRIVRVEELPAGWLGKVHALHRGVEAATGEWLLFSDADVFVAPGALKRAVAYALRESTDMIALVPEFRTGSLWVDAAWADFMRALALAADPDAVRDPKRRAVLGSGSFNLVRREAFDATPGFEHLRLETGDDVALGKMVKDAGGTVELLNGRGLLSVAIYRSVGEYLRGIEKNGSSLAHRPFALVLALFAAILVVAFSPVVATVAAAAAGPPWLLALGAATTVVTTAAFCSGLWVNTRTWFAGLLWPVGVTLMVYGVLRAVYLAHRRGGVVWRDTFYSLDELHEGRRFTL